MTKQEYLKLLQEKMEHFNRELQREITEDYEQHFAEGIAAGKTEEEIVEELGDIEDMIRELPEEDMMRWMQPAEDRMRWIQPEEDMMRGIQPAEEPSECSHTYQGSYQAVVIDGLIADVTVERSENDKISVSYKNDGDLRRKYRFYQYEEGGIFYTGVKKDLSEEHGERKKGRRVMLFGQTVISLDNRGLYWNDVDVQLTVKIPAGLPRVELKTTSGNAVISGIQGEQLDIVTQSGDVKLSGSNTQQIKVKTASGDEEIVDVACTELCLHAASGDMNANRVIAAKLTAQTGSGDIQVRHIRVDELTASAGSGDIAARGEIGTCTVKTGSGDVGVVPEGAVRQVRVATGSGDVSLDMRKVSDVEIQVIIGSGDGVIHRENGERYEVSYGRRSCTVGSGECKAFVNTGSGDVVVRCQ